jgi:hypothetical protein
MSAVFSFFFNFSTMLVELSDLTNETTLSVAEAKLFVTAKTAETTKKRSLFISKQFKSE